MSKRERKVTSLRPGRRVRWTGEVSADVDAKKLGQTRTAPRKQRQTTTSRTRRVAQRVTSPVAHSAAPETHSPAPGRRARHLQIITMAMAVVFVVAISVSRRPASLAAAAVTDVQPERAEQSSDTTTAPRPVASAVARIAEPPVAAPRIVPNSPDKTVPKPEKNRIAESAVPIAEVPPVVHPVVTENPTTRRTAFDSIDATPAAVSPASLDPGAVTITGCLEVNDKNQFRLTETEGIDAPKSRSWRSGFLKKRSTSVDLIQPPDPGALHTQVGQRVAATGSLTGREFRLASLRPVGPRCD